MRTALAAASALFALSCLAKEPARPAQPQVLGRYHIKASELPAAGAGRVAANSADVVAGPAGAALTVPPGFRIAEYAGGFSEPRNMIEAPNGDVLLADSGRGEVVVLRDANHDGVAESRAVFADSLSRPFGLAVWREWLYVGTGDAIVRFPYRTGQTKAGAPPQSVASLPGGGHWTRNIIFSPDGAKLFVAVGSRSNVSTGEDPVRAAISVMNPDGSGRSVYASGLRNPVGLAFYPGTSTLWTAVNERDELGDDLPPDYATSVRQGEFFGWPYAYIGTHPDPRNGSKRPDLVQKTRVPDVLIQAHSAALGLAFYNGTMFPADYRGDGFVALHGSWNRAQLTGYKVIRLRFDHGKPTGGYDDFVVGWQASGSRVWGRPVGVLVLRDGSLLIADDGGNRVWRVSYGK
jgi:glucose/arabinose dehydrogenase